VPQPDLLLVAVHADAHHAFEDAARVKDRHAGRACERAEALARVDPLR
jgi:hypothetical protein